MARLMRAASRASAGAESAPVTPRQATRPSSRQRSRPPQLHAERPNALGAGRHPTLAGFLYPALGLDAWSRRIVGWALSSDLKTRARRSRHGRARPGKLDNAVHHSIVRGSQYTSVAFAARCKETGVRPSTGSAGDAYDNAMGERVFAPSNAR